MSQIKSQLAPFAMTVCNPPFYDSVTESEPLKDNAHGSDRAQRSDCESITASDREQRSDREQQQRVVMTKNPTRQWSATQSELAYPGGEVAFVTKVRSYHHRKRNFNPIQLGIYFERVAQYLSTFILSLAHVCVPLHYMYVLFIVVKIVVDDCRVSSQSPRLAMVYHHAR